VTFRTSILALYSNIYILHSVEFANHSHSMDAIENNFSKHFSSDEKKLAIALWKAKVPLKTIRDQCNMSEKTLWRILTHACPGKENRNRKLLDSMPRRLEEVIARQSAST
jgi:hypothetical protein